MRVLVVLAHPPLPEGSAAGRYGVALIRGLRAHGLDVTTLAADLGGASAAAPAPDLGVEVMPVALEPGWGTRVHRYADPLSFLGRGPFAARVRELVPAADVVHLEEAMSAAAGRRLPIPTVCHLHCLARRDRTASAPWSADFRVFLELARAEARIQRRSRWLLASSGEVAGDLRRHGARDVTVVPLALDPSHYAPAGDADAPVAGLIGSANWPPTRDAVARLLVDVWPRVLARRPGALLRLAGRGMMPTSFPGLASSPGVEWVGPVDSAPDFLRSVGLLLYPLGRGSGTKVKVLEAMAMGLPVVTTPPGAEGLEPGAGVQVEADPRRLAQLAAELLADPAARRERGASARAQFARDHNPVAAALPLPGLYERMLADLRIA